MPSLPRSRFAIGNAGFAEPDIVPDDPVEEFALHDDELELVAWSAGLGVE